MESDVVHYLNRRVRTGDNEAKELMERFGTGFTDDIEETKKKFGEEVKR